MENLSGGSGFGVYDSAGQLMRYDDSGYSWTVDGGLLIVSVLITSPDSVAPVREVREIYAGSWHLQV